MKSLKAVRKVVTCGYFGQITNVDREFLNSIIAKQQHEIESFRIEKNLRSNFELSYDLSKVQFPVVQDV